MRSGVKLGTYFATASLYKKGDNKNEQTLHDLSYFKRTEWKNQRIGKSGLRLVYIVSQEMKGR